MLRKLLLSLILAIPFLPSAPVEYRNGPVPGCLPCPEDRDDPSRVR